MKKAKLLALILATLMAIASFVACGEQVDESTEADNAQTEDTSGETEAPVNANLDAYGREIVEDGIPKDRNYSGRPDNSVTFFTRNDSTVQAIEMDTDQTTNDTLNDAIFNRNITVENRLGVEINQISQLGNWGPHTEWLQTLRNAVNTKTGDFDAAAVYASQGAALALEGCYYNVLEIEDIDLSKPWWNDQLSADLELFDTLYFLGGDIAITEVTESGIVLYNKTLFNEYFTDLDLYALVDNYEWTIDKLYEISSQVWEDANNTGVIDDGDVLGFVGWDHMASEGWMDIWMAALGISATERNSDGYPELSIYSPRSIDAFEKLVKLHRENQGAPANRNCKDHFSEGIILFTNGALKTGESLRDMKDPYGALPLPMYDADQGYYATYPQNGCSLVTVLSTLTDDRKEMIGSVLELMAAESYRQVIPEYYEVCLKSKYSADAADARMYDIIVQGIRLDFGFVYASTQLQTINGLFRNLDRDFAQTYESNREKYESALDLLVDKLDELSFNMG